jgi:hypothetical protein
MTIPPDKLHVIREILATYLETPFTRSGDFRDIARQYSAVPTFEGWTAITFLRTDGTFFNYETEDRLGEITSEDNEEWQLASLRYASEKYPRFAELLPTRPLDATECSFCRGEGLFLPKTLGNPSRIVCGECGGTGWKRLSAG